MHTAEGRAVLAIIGRRGVWRRAGMGAVLAGLDMADALAGLPRNLDRDLTVQLLTIAEAAFLPARQQLEQELVKAHG